MTLPTVTIEGRAVDIPELRFTPSGLAVAKIRMVASDQKKNEETGKWEDTKTLWIDVTAWRQLAENVAESIDKGDLITVVGKLQTEEWESKEGEKRSKISLTAFSVAASLQFRTIRHGEGKAARSGGAAAAERDPWASTAPDDEPPF